MKNKDYSLVILHHEEVFETREAAMQYLEDEYQPCSLEAEPIIVKYGEQRNPNVILAFGTSDASPRGSFYAIDIKKTEEIVEEIAEQMEDDKEEFEFISDALQGIIDATGLTLDENKIEDKISYEPDSRDDVIGNATTIAEAIDLLSKYIQDGLSNSQIIVEDTESVALIYSVNTNGGMLLKAKVKISEDGSSDNLTFNDNIIGIKNDGIYATSHLSYDDVRHRLTFTTSGYRNGRFQDDANVETIELGEHTKLVPNNEGKTVKISVSEDSNRTSISADLQIADRENNILKVSDGKVYVEGLAKNIKYGESTVAATLTAHKNRLDTLETNLSNEITRATAAEQANSSRIEEIAEAVGSGSEQVLADAKAYTDTKVTAEKTEREAKDVELATAIQTAKRDAADDATEKAARAKTEANAYTDTQVLAEKNRAEAAEAANATAITNETTRAEAAEAALTTEVNKKIETVEIVKNSQSDLQYTLKVDGQDVGEINIPKDQFLKSVTYDGGNKELVFVFETTEGTVTTTVSVNDLVDTYTAGNGLVLTDNEFSVKLNEDSESYLSVSDEGIKLLGIDAALAEKANVQDVYTKNEIDNKGFLTEHQDISNLATIASVEAVDDKADANETAIQNLESEVDDMKFVTNETDTVRMTMVKETGAETRVLSSDVKLKTLSGENANIIKSDANGLYATVSFNYDKATNKITFNDGNGNKEFELNNFGILQDAFYDSDSNSIVLIVKKDDETTERITIPVGDLLNTWTVENAENSPVILTKTEGNDGDVLSATISILNNENNLLVNQNGSLFVDGDSNSHKALWGNEVTSVQGAISLLKERTDDIEEMKENIEELQEDNENIKIAIASYQTDLENQKERITTNENNITTLVEKTHDLEVSVAVLTERVNGLDERITEASEKATEALNAVNDLADQIGDIDTSKGSISDRLDTIEDVLRQLIDFGEYDIQIYTK